MFSMKCTTAVAGRDEQERNDDAVKTLPQYHPRGSLDGVEAP